MAASTSRVAAHARAAARQLLAASDVPPAWGRQTSQCKHACGSRHARRDNRDQMTQSYVVTGAARGIGRAISERLSDAGHVVAIDRDPEALAWTCEHPRVTGVPSDAGSEADAARAADVAEHEGRLVGWVNNAAVFRDLAVHDAPAADVLELSALNLGLAVTGCAIAVPAFSRAIPPARSSTCPLTRPSGPCAARCPTRPPRPRSRV
jgi:NAD(P)-dependent dehydrogenase (short-subunit alcohol dehydrogenase family)